jgi:hypothetical protein
MIIFHTINIAICHRVGEYKDAFAQGSLCAALGAEKSQDYPHRLLVDQGRLK